MSRLTHLDAGAIRHPPSENPRKGLPPAGEQRESFAAILGDVTQEAGPASTAAARPAAHAGKTSSQARHPRDEQSDVREASSDDGADAALLGVEALPAAPPTPPLALPLAPTSGPSPEPAEEPVAFSMPEARFDEAGQEEDLLSPLARIKAYVLEQATYFQPVQAFATKSERSATGEASAADPSGEAGDAARPAEEPAPLATGGAEETSADGDADIRPNTPLERAAVIGRPEPAFARRRATEFSGAPPPARFSELTSGGAQPSTERAEIAASERLERPAAGEGAGSVAHREPPHAGSRAPVAPGRGDPSRAAPRDWKLANPAPGDLDTAHRSEDAAFDETAPLGRADRKVEPAVSKPEPRAPALPDRSKAQDRGFTIPARPFAKAAATRSDAGVDQTASLQQTEGSTGRVVSESRSYRAGFLDQGEPRSAKLGDRTPTAPALRAVEAGGAMDDAGRDRIPSREPPVVFTSREDRVSDTRARAFLDAATPQAAPAPDGGERSQPASNFIGAPDDAGLDAVASRGPPGVVADRENRRSDAPAFLDRAASPAMKRPLEAEPTDGSLVDSMPEPEGPPGSLASTETLVRTDEADVGGAASRAPAGTAGREAMDFKSYGPPAFDRDEQPAAVHADRMAATPMRPSTEALGATDDAGVDRSASGEPPSIAAGRKSRDLAPPAIFDRDVAPVALQDGDPEIPVREPVAAPAMNRPRDAQPTDRSLVDSAPEFEGPLGSEASTEVLGKTGDTGVDGAASRTQAKPMRPSTEILGATEDAGVDYIASGEAQGLVTGRDGEGREAPAVFDRAAAPVAQRDRGPEIPLREPGVAAAMKRSLDPRPADRDEIEPASEPDEVGDSRPPPIARDPAIPTDGSRAIRTRAADAPMLPDGYGRNAESLRAGPLPVPAPHFASAAAGPARARPGLAAETTGAFAAPARPAGPVTHSEDEPHEVPASGVPAAAPGVAAAVSGGEATRIIGAGLAIEGPIAASPPRLETDDPTKVTDRSARLPLRGDPRPRRETPPRQGMPVAGLKPGARLQPRAEAERPSAGAPARHMTDSDPDAPHPVPLAEGRLPPGPLAAGAPTISGVVNPPDRRMFEAVRVAPAPEDGRRAPPADTGSLRATPSPARLVPNDIEPQFAGKEAPVFQPPSHAAAGSRLHAADATHTPTRSPPAAAAVAVETADAAIPTRAAEPARSGTVFEVADDRGHAAAAMGAMPPPSSDSTLLAEDDSRSQHASVGVDQAVLNGPIEGAGRTRVSDQPVLTPMSPLPAPQLQRIADIINAAAAEPALLPASAVPGSALPVRTMTIELHPGELGTVTVKLRLVGGELSVALHASRPATAQLLKREEDTLNRLLATDGHQVAIAGIDTAPPSLAPVGPPAQAGGSPAPAGNLPQAGGSEGRDAPSSNPRSGGDAPRGERRPDEQSASKGDNGDTVPQLRPGNIYV